MMKKLTAWMLVFALCLTLVACGAPTEEPEETVAEATDVLAVVVTGDVTTEVTTIDELVAAVDPSGNTQITLARDAEENKPIRLPYSCTFDFNGFTFATSPNDGNGIEIAAVGTENDVTTLKNGTLTQYGVGVRVNAGAIVIENMNIFSRRGNVLALYDTKDAYKSVNAIRNSTLSTAVSCVTFNEASANFGLTGITIDNSTLISHDPDGAEVFSEVGTGITSGVINLGENVKFYSYCNTLAPEDGYVYSGNPVYINDTKSVDVDGTAYDGINCWATGTDDVFNVLMIGNSFSYYFCTELYNIANAAGVQMNVTNLYKSGASVEEHWTWLSDLNEGENKYTYWVINSMGRWRPDGILSSTKALAYMDWDVITLQQHFKPEVTVDYETAKTSCDPYVEKIYDVLKSDYPNAKLYWQETWAYQVGHELIADAAAQKHQQDIIIKVSEEVCQENGVDMVPSGEAWVIARSNELVGDTLCLDDKYHDGDVGGGQYLNACVWFEVLTGKSCIGNTWRPDNYELSEELVAELQKAAHQAVAERYGEDYAK